MAAGNAPIMNAEMARSTRGPAQDKPPRRKTARRAGGAASPGPGRTPARSSRRASAGTGRKPSAYGCLFWIVLLAVIVAVGFAAREPLARLLREPLKQAFGRDTGGQAAKTDGKPSTTPTQESPAHEAAAAPAAKPAPAASAARPEPSPSAPAARQPERSAPGPARPDPSRPAAPARPLRTTRVYFLAAGQDGSAAVTAVERQIPQSDSPLRDALESLLTGPDPKDRAKGLTTGIPPETRLRSVTVRDGIATVDLSESFRFTASGVEGLTAELRQVVETAAEFPTVRTVQILIEGRKVQYLGTEGIRIDEPLSPGSLAP
jgi:hypothetical protein